MNLYMVHLDLKGVELALVPWIISNMNLLPSPCYNTLTCFGITELSGDQLVSPPEETI